MGSTVSNSLRVNYASSDNDLDMLEDQDINTIYEILIKNYKSKIYAQLIYEKAVYTKPGVMFKYAMLVRRLEKVKDNEDKEFIQVFKAHIKAEVQSAVDRARKNDPEIVDKVGMNIARFLGSLLVENVIDVKTFQEVLKPAKAKQQFKSIFSYLSTNNKIRDKLRAEKIMSFEDLFQGTSDLRSDNESFESILKEAKDYESYCEVYKRVMMKIPSQDIGLDEHLFSPKLVASLNMTTSDQMQDFCDKFLDRCVQHESYLPVFAQIALRIHSALQENKLSKEISFKDHLIETISLRFESLYPTKNELDQRLIVGLYAEMYNINWINKMGILGFIGVLKNAEKRKFIVLMQILLKIAGLKLSIQGSKDQMAEVREEMKRLAKKENKDGRLKYMIHDAIISLNYIIATLEQFEQKPSPIKNEPKVEVVEEKLTIDNLFKEISEEAYAEVINDVKSVPIQKPADFISNLIQKAITTCAVLIARATRDLCTTYAMKDLLSNKCLTTLLDYLNNPNKCSSTLRLVHYIGELYNLDVLSNECINVCIDQLCSDEREIATTCLSALFRCVGSKMEIANAEKINFIFIYFEQALKEAHTSRTRVFKKLISLRANDWNEHGIQHSYEDFLMLYTIEGATVDEVAVKFHSGRVEVEKFILALWKVILKEPHPLYAELCKKLSILCRYDFYHELEKFLEARCNSFANLESQHYNESVNCRLGRVVVFVTELFQLDVIPEYLFENWIDPKLASKIPQQFIATILSIAALKVNEVEKNGKLKILLANLEHINDDKSQMRYNTLCGDMIELKEAMQEIKVHQNHT